RKNKIMEERSQSISLRKRILEKRKKGSKVTMDIVKASSEPTYSPREVSHWSLGLLDDIRGQGPKCFSLTLLIS
ncbi:hypothetical protein V4Y02_24260, partial [Escherichia coli]